MVILALTTLTKSSYRLSLSPLTALIIILGLTTLTDSHLTLNLIFLIALIVILALTDSVILIALIKI